MTTTESEVPLSGDAIKRALIQGGKRVWLHVEYEGVSRAHIAIPKELAVKILAAAEAQP